MPTKEILNSYSVVELRKEVSKTNIKGYSKMKKSEVVELMMKPNNKPKFHHIKVKTKAKAAPPAPAPKKTYKFKKKEKAKPAPAPAKPKSAAKPKVASDKAAELVKRVKSLEERHGIDKEYRIKGGRRYFTEPDERTDMDNHELLSMDEKDWRLEPRSAGGPRYIHYYSKKYNMFLGV